MAEREELAGEVGQPRRRDDQTSLAVPLHNEERVLSQSVRRLHHHLAGWPSWRITIVDNASTDGTWREARRLATELSGVDAIHVDRKGRGLALRTAWRRADADIVAYTDVDLSTGLDALAELVSPLRAERATSRSGRVSRPSRGSSAGSSAS